MINFHKNTCIRFVPRTNEKNFVKIFKGPGCFSSVGRNKGGQLLSLGDGCLDIGTVVHELNHVVGFYHEQNRPDRDKYVKIFWDNIQSGKNSQFIKYLLYRVTLFDELDYNSVMMYGETFFSKDGHSKTMVATKPGVRLVDVGNKPGLSKSDIFRINKLYKCRLA
ncbi:astacin-like metalloprotease toxin 2 [Centruroides vittatus]|uniref:astacin-like metalloprotease toxin 2 n=1 Tax=Centruroides vittatus TaxID=120091 RepID=UPI00350F51A2